MIGHRPRPAIARPTDPARAADRRATSPVRPAFGEALEPVVGNRLPLRGVRHEGAPARAHARVAVERRHAHAHPRRVVRVAAEQVRAALAAEELLPSAVRMPPGLHQLLALRRSGGCGRRSTPTPTRRSRCGAGSACSGSSRQPAPARPARSARRRRGSAPSSRVPSCRRVGVLRRREVAVDELDAVAVRIGDEADPVLGRPPGWYGASPARCRPWRGSGAARRGSGPRARCARSRRRGRTAPRGPR